MKRFLLSVLAVVAFFAVSHRPAVRTDIFDNQSASYLESIFSLFGPETAFAATRNSNGTVGQWSRKTFPSEVTVNTDVDVAVELLISSAASNVTQANKYGACPIVSVCSTSGNLSPSRVGFDSSDLLMNGRAIYPLPASGPQCESWGPVKGINFDARLVYVYGASANQILTLRCDPLKEPQ